MRTQFESVNTRVLAINPASVKAHQSYAARMGFTFPILSDPGEKTVAKYRCRKPTGKGVLRTVYAVDPDGKVLFAERGHADLRVVLETIKLKGAR